MSSPLKANTSSPKAYTSSDPLATTQDTPMNIGKVAEVCPDVADHDGGWFVYRMLPLVGVVNLGGRATGEDC